VRVLGLPQIPQLGDGLLLASGDEDRVEAESLRAPWRSGDAALQDPDAAELLSGRRQRDQLADVAGPPPLALDALELGEQALDVFAGSESRRLDARPTREAFDF